MALQGACGRGQLLRAGLRLEPPLASASARPLSPGGLMHCPSVESRGAEGRRGQVSGVSSEVTHTELQHSGVLKRGRYLMRVRSKTPEQMSPWNLQERGSKRPKAKQGMQACTGQPGPHIPPRGCPEPRESGGGGRSAPDPAALAVTASSD